MKGNKKFSKEIRLILLIVFYGAIFLAVKTRKLFFDDSIYIKILIWILLIIHVFYEGLYKEYKIEKKKENIKQKHYVELQSRLEEFTPKIKPSVLPKELIGFIPIIEKWGIDNNMLRNLLYEKASKEELKQLKTIESQSAIIETWINENPQEFQEVKALELTQQSYDDLGLWTWQSKNE